MSLESKINKFNQNPSDYNLRINSKNQLSIIKKGFFSWIKIKVLDCFSSGTSRMDVIRKYVFDNKDNLETLNNGTIFLQNVDIKIRQWNEGHNTSIPTLKTFTCEKKNVRFNNLSEIFKQEDYEVARYFKNFSANVFSSINASTESKNSKLVQLTVSRLFPSGEKGVLDYSNLLDQIIDPSSNKKSELLKLQKQRLHSVEVLVQEVSKDTFNFYLTVT